MGSPWIIHELRLTEHGTGHRWQGYEIVIRQAHDDGYNEIVLHRVFSVVERLDFSIGDEVRVDIKFDFKTSPKV
jgi:hypothetical protein